MISMYWFSTLSGLDVCVPPEFICWNSNSLCDCIWSKEVVMVNKLIRVGPWSNRVSVLIRIDTREFDLSLCSHVHAPRKGHVSTQWEGRHLQARKESSPETTMLAWWFQISSLHNCEEINFCCLSHPVCGILSWQTNSVQILSRVLMNKNIKCL